MKDQEKKKLLSGTNCKGNGEEDRDPSDRSRPQHAVTAFSKRQRIPSSPNSDKRNVSVRTHVGSSALVNVKVYTGLILIYKYDTASHAGHSARIHTTKQICSPSQRSSSNC